jgi:hypothetical protein
VKQDDLDEIETRQIVRIAEAHGGSDNGDKDRIGKLLPVEHFHNEPVRLRLVAAILRFADELSDDRSRVSRFLIEQGNVPKSSEIFHAYAYSLRSVRVSPETNEISLDFVVDRRGATTLLGIGNEERYLLDYIKERTLKMHYERAYCSRFMSKHGIDIERIRIRIQFLDEHGEQFREEITYDLTDSGYPDSQDIHAICADLRTPAGEARWTGATIRAEIEAQGGGGADARQD